MRISNSGVMGLVVAAATITHVPTIAEGDFNASSQTVPQFGLPSSFAFFGCTFESISRKIPVKALAITMDLNVPTTNFIDSSAAKLKAGDIIYDFGNDEFLYRNGDATGIFGTPTRAGEHYAQLLNDLLENPPPLPEICSNYLKSRGVVYKQRWAMAPSRNI